MYRQPKKADYIEFMRAQGLRWNDRQMRICIEEAEYDEAGDIVNWYAGDTYEGRTLRNTPAGKPLMLDVRDEHGDKVDDFCIIINPATGEILDAWSETDPAVHTLLREIGLGTWDNLPQPPPLEKISPEIYDALDNLGPASIPDNEYTLSEIKALAQRLNKLLGEHDD